MAELLFLKPEEPPKKTEHYKSEDVKTQLFEGMAYEKAMGVLAFTDGMQKVTEVVTIKVEKGGAAIDLSFLTPEIIAKANQLVVDQPTPNWMDRDSGNDIKVFGDDMPSPT